MLIASIAIATTQLMSIASHAALGWHCGYNEWAYVLEWIEDHSLNICPEFFVTNDKWFSHCLYPFPDFEPQFAQGAY
jgi:hypothetical protein